MALKPLAQLSFKIYFNEKFIHVIWTKLYDEESVALWLLKKINATHDVRIETYYMESFVKEQVWARK